MTREPKNEGGACAGASPKLKLSTTGPEYTAPAAICKRLPDAVVIPPGAALHPAAALRPRAIVVVLGELREHGPETVKALARFGIGHAGPRVPVAVARRRAAEGRSVAIVICREPWWWRDAVDDVVRIKRFGAGGRWWRPLPEARRAVR